MSRSGGSMSLTTRSPIRIDPDVTSSSPATIRSSVVLPQPDGPTKIMNSPSLTVRFISSTASVPLGKRLLTPSNSIEAIDLAPDSEYRRTMFSPLVDVFGDQEVIRLFSEESLVAAWLEFERALADAQAELGVIPPDAAREIAAAAVPEHVDLPALREQTLVVGYPILPLLDQIVQRSPTAGRYLHRGATTQDVMDTGLALVGGRALDRIERVVRTLGDGLATLAQEHRRTVMPGRTHAQPAVPIAFGGKAAVWLSELVRHVERLRSARAGLAVVQLHGAAGTAAALGPRSRDVRWHTARDGVAEAGVALATLAGLCGRLAREVVELSRPEIGELREEGGHHRGASSTMPQKANPIGSEAVIGMSLLAAHHAGALLAALQGTHERSAGEWQVEWDAAPAVFAAAAGAVSGTARIVEGLRIFPERMRANLELDGGTIMAEEIGRAHV